MLAIWAAFIVVAMNGAHSCKIKIIDAHLHVWHPRGPWLGSDPGVLAEVGSVESLISHMDEAAVDGSTGTP